MTLNTHRFTVITAYFGLVLILGTYCLIGLVQLIEGPVSHDELIYLIKSWWIFSGQAEWYSNEMRLWYMPNAYVAPGLAQYLFGQGIIEARSTGYIAGLATLILVFFYTKKIANSNAALLAVIVLATAPSIYGWASVSVHGISALLIICTLIACSDRFIQNSNVRVILTSILLCGLLFARLNHLITVVLFIPIIFFSNRNSPFRITLTVAVTTSIIGIGCILLLPTDFIYQADTLGIYKILPQWVPIYEPPPYQWSEQYLAGASGGDGSETPSAVSTSLEKPLEQFLGQGGSVKSVIFNLWPDLVFGFLSFRQNFSGFAQELGIISIGATIALLGNLVRPRQLLPICLASAFFVFVFVSFVKGYGQCSSCPVIYSSYFVVPGAIVAGIGYSYFLRDNWASRLIVVACLSLPLLTAKTLYSEIRDNRFIAEEKSDLAELATNIQELIPEGETALPVGTLPSPNPIRLGLFLANRFYEPALINPAFTFMPVSVQHPIADSDKSYILSRGHWTPHHLLDWIETKYDYILKPTYLYYDDHKYRYWFRRLYYPADARELIQKHFTCSRIPGNYQAIHPIDFCKRKAAS